MTVDGAHRRSETPAEEWRAVVDIGSVSAQLLLTDGVQRIRRSVDTHLGAGTLSPQGEATPALIDPDALERLRVALVDYRQLAGDADATIRAFGTAAARRASNRQDLDTIVVESLGVPLEVVDPAQESAMALAGAWSGLVSASTSPRAPKSPSPSPSPSSPTPVSTSPEAAITIDVGGGSTDFCLGVAGRPNERWSMPLGAVLVTDAYLHGDPPRPEELSAALSVVELHLDDLRRESPGLAEALSAPDAVALGLGGVVTIAAVEVGLLDDPLNGDGDGPLHGFRLDRDAVEDVFRTLATETSADRGHNPGLPATRVDDIVGGCIVLVETMRQFDLDAVVVSQRGAADGALLRADTGKR